MLLVLLAEEGIFVPAQSHPRQVRSLSMQTSMNPGTPCYSHLGLMAPRQVASSYVKNEANQKLSHSAGAAPGKYVTPVQKISRAADVALELKFFRHIGPYW